MKKKMFLIACAFVSSFAFSQQTDTFKLSEDESREIVASGEFQNVFNLQNQFLDKIDNAVRQGVSLDFIKKETIDAIHTNNNQSIYSLLFGNYSTGETFISNLTNAKKAFINKYPALSENLSSIVCNTCPKSLVDDANYFFKNFNAFNTNRFNPQSDLFVAGRAAGPTCGSWWNQVRLGVCAGACGILTVGIGAAACGWGCWCTFCTRNSALASIICAD